MEAGAQTEEGYSVTRITFRSGDSVLVIPAEVEDRLTQETGLRLVTHFIFQPNTNRRIIMPWSDPR